VIFENRIIERVQILNRDCICGKHLTELLAVFEILFVYYIVDFLYFSNVFFVLINKCREPIRIHLRSELFVAICHPEYATEKLSHLYMPCEAIIRSFDSVNLHLQACITIQ